MTARDHLVGFSACALLATAHLVAFVVVVLRGLGVELADDVRASRNETVNSSAPGGSMQKNRKVRDFDSTKLLRAVNAELAARQGDTKRVEADLAEARKYAESHATTVFAVRRAS